MDIVAADRPPVSIYSGRTPTSACTATIATARFPMLRRNPGLAAASGLPASPWAITITTAIDDLFITCWGQNILFHNNGDGTFTDVTESAGLLHGGTRFGTGCTWIDYDRDGKLDLFVSHYAGLRPRQRSRRAARIPRCNCIGVPVLLRPGGIAAGPCRLYHNNGDGTFTDVSEKAGILAGAARLWPDRRGGRFRRRRVAGYSMSPATPVTACSSTIIMTARSPSRVWRAASRRARTARNRPAWDVGIGDFDTDGYLDIFKTHFRGDTHALYRNNGKGFFRDVTLRAGLGVETRFVSWGAGIVDLDNDGLPDLFLATGMVYPEVEEKLAEVPYKLAEYPVPQSGRRPVRGIAG